MWAMRRGMQRMVVSEGRSEECELDEKTRGRTGLVVFILELALRWRVTSYKVFLELARSREFWRSL